MLHTYDELESEHGPIMLGALLSKESYDRELKRSFAAPGGLLKFVKHFWHVLEPEASFMSGWALEAMCLHLEAVSRGQITRLLINISPGAMKSLLTNVFWPAWEWGALNRPSIRYLSFSYSANYPERDNRRLRDLLRSVEYVNLFGRQFSLTKDGEELIATDKTGWKQAGGILGSVTGSRGDRVILDDPNAVNEAESEPVRTKTGQFFLEGIRNRLNHLENSAIIVIQQRVHEADVSGIILDSDLDYVHLCIPCIFDGRTCETMIGWSDPRTELGECFWPERYPPSAIQEAQEGSEYSWAGQYQQAPEPRGGGLIKRDYWNLWDPQPNPKTGKQDWPRCDFILASLDPAFTSKEENDPSGFTVWGCFRTPDGFPAVILLDAFAKKLDIVGRPVDRWPGETDADYRGRTGNEWGLAETVHERCKRLRVNHLLIESKASGQSVAQVLTKQSQFLRRNYKISLVDPGRFDKTVRVQRVIPEFANGQIWIPNRKWADMVVDQCAIFPRGKHDDLVDSMSQAIYWLRQQGFLERKDEAKFQGEEAMKRRKDPPPLYNV